MALRTRAPERRKEIQKSLNGLTLAAIDRRVTVKEGCSQFSSASKKTFCDLPIASCNPEALTEDLDELESNKPARSPKSVGLAAMRKREQLTRTEALEEPTMTQDTSPDWNGTNTSERQTTLRNSIRKVDSHVSDGLQNVHVQETLDMVDVMGEKECRNQQLLDTLEKEFKLSQAGRLKASIRFMKETKELKGHDENKLRPDSQAIQTIHAENGVELNKDEHTRPIATKHTAEHDFEKMYMDIWGSQPAMGTSKDPGTIEVPKIVNDGLEMPESQIARRGYEDPWGVFRTSRQTYDQRFGKDSITTMHLTHKGHSMSFGISPEEMEWLQGCIPSMLVGDNVEPGYLDLRDMIVLLIERMSPSSLHDLWRQIPTSIKEKLWHQLMRLTLQLQPTKALGFLYATFTNPQQPALEISHALLDVIKHYQQNPQQYPDHYLNDLIETVFYIAAESPRGTIRLQSTTIHFLMQNLDELSMKQFCRIFLRQHQSLWQSDDLVQFAKRLARVGETDTAFEILQKLRLEDFNTPQILKLCSTILQNVRLSTGAVYTEVTIFKTMLELGLRPNAITHNVLMECSTRAGDHQTAWKIFHMMDEAGIEPDSYSYSILLNDAKKRMDYEAIKSAMNLIRDSGIKSSPIVADILHSIFLLNQKRRASNIVRRHGVPLEPAFTQMLPVYCEHFHVEKLARFISCHERLSAKIAALEIEVKDKQADAALRYHPDGAALRIMLAAYLSDMKHPHSAASFYKHVQDLVQRGDPCMEDMMDNTYLWNIILMALGRHVLLPDCAKLLGDMLSSRAGIADKSLPLELPKPDVYTWSIMLKIFVDQLQPRAAEKVLEMMAERGIQPTIVTWNILIDVYAKLQDAEMTGDTLSRLEAAGLEADEVTFNTVGKLKDRKSFHRYMTEKNQRRPQTAEKMAPVYEPDSGKQPLSAPSTSIKSQGEQHNFWADEPAKPMDGQDDITPETALGSTLAETNDLNLRIDNIDRNQQLKARLLERLSICSHDQKIQAKAPESMPEEDNHFFPKAIVNPEPSGPLPISHIQTPAEDSKTWALRC